MSLIRPAKRENPSKHKAKVNKDGSPRKKPGPKPKTEVATLRTVAASTASQPLTWPAARRATIREGLTPEEAMETCATAYTDITAAILRELNLQPGQLPTPEQATGIKEMGATAYRCALPVLKPATAMAYIACVAQGVSLDVFTGKVGSQLLYAAQVVTTAARAAERRERNAQ